jgi:hypothetical protein
MGNTISLGMKMLRAVSLSFKMRRSISVYMTMQSLPETLYVINRCDYLIKFFKLCEV